jgi:hypothetical protein
MVTIFKYIDLQIRMTINVLALFKIFTIVKATSDVPKSEVFKFAILV